MAANGRGPETLWNGEQRNSLEDNAEQLQTYCKPTAGVTLQPLLWAACGSFQAADTLPLTGLLGTVLQCSKAHQLGDWGCTFALGTDNVTAITGTHKKTQLSWDSGTWNRKGVPEPKPKAEGFKHRWQADFQHLQKHHSGTGNLVIGASFEYGPID